MLHRCPCGGRLSSNVRRRAAASMPIDRLRPRPGASRHRPSGPCCSKRRRHNVTVRGVSASRCAMARTDIPCATSNTMRVRVTTRCGVVPARIHDARSWLSASLMPIPVQADGAISETRHHVLSATRAWRRAFVDALRRLLSPRAGSTSDPGVHGKATTPGKQGHSISRQTSVRPLIRDAATRARRPSPV